MVIDKILTALDAVTAFVLATHVAFGWFSPAIVAYHAAYIILKGAVFSLSDWASRFDVAIGIYMLLVTFDVYSLTIVTVISVVWLLQKGVSAFIVPIFKMFF